MARRRRPVAPIDSNWIEGIPPADADTRVTLDASSDKGEFNDR
jgi:hypothetical protein